MPIPAGDDGALLTLADARAHLNKTSSVDDDELLYFIAAATRVIERLAGPVVPRAVTEVVRQRGGVRSLILASRPVLSVTSATSIRDGATLDASALYVDNALAGIVRRADGGAITGGPWTVVYQAGRDGIPENIGLAARILVAHLWETQRGGPMVPPSVSGAVEDYTIPGLWFAIPDKVKQLLEGEAAPVVAF